MCSPSLCIGFFAILYVVAVPFCSVLENDLGGDCAELPVADGFGFSLTAPGDSYLQYLGATFDVGDGTSGACFKVYFHYYSNVVCIPQLHGLPQ